MTLICGVDEAGRGPLCGPVFASAVILDDNSKIKNLDDSKKMMQNMPFKGPFIIVARISPSGSPMDKSGLEVKTSKAISLGAKDIQLTLIGGQ